MSNAIHYDPTIWSYGFAALIFAAFAIRLSLSWRGGTRAYVVLGAAIASALWAGFVFASLFFPVAEYWRLARVFDMVRVGAWLAFLLLLLGEWPEWPVFSGRSNARFWRIVGTVGLLVAATLLPEDLPWQDTTKARATTAVFLVLLGISVLGLALTEQLYRRTPENRQWAIKPLLIGLAGMFAFDLLMYAEAVLFKHLDPGMWAARGVAHAFVVFFVAVATARNTSWTIDLHVSRGVVFYSTAVFLAGGCLLIVAAAGYWVRLFGGGWGETLQITFVFAAILCLAVLVLSGSLRSRLRVFINKNLFSFRYDYRKEWLQFTHVLATTAGGSDLHEKVVTALANLVESKGGALWLERGGAFCQVACENLPEVREHESLSGSLPTFLGRTGLVIRIDEVNIAPTLYAGLTLPLWLLAQTDAWLVIPLPNGAEIVGFVVLARPRTPVDINWEVLDLLKTASQQAASYLVQYRANEALLEAEKFDAFNRMSAFVVHDLKNLIAQLALLLKNAERHRDNPEFQADMQETIEHVVERMNRLMLQLAAGAAPGVMPRPIPLRELIDRVVATKREYRTGIAVESGQDLRALAHEEQLERVIGHIVQNAIEATGDRGSQIKVRTYSEKKYAVIEIVDAGVGMSEEFVRERLFRPFQTTKPQGMGIGMNESFQYVSGIGGRITVESIENAGTCFRVFLRNAEVTP